MRQKKRMLRRSGIQIMLQLIRLLGDFALILLLAVLNGSVGYLCAMGVTLAGAVGAAKVLGEPITLSYGALAGIAIAC